MKFKIFRSTLLISFFIFLVFDCPSQAGLKVIIDPGHGGTDRGAVYGLAQESRIVLDIAKSLKDILENTHQMDVILTRDSDRNISLQDRVQKAESNGVDLFISLHANAATDSRAKGLEFFIQEPWSLQTTLETETVSHDLSKKSDISAILSDLKNQNKLLTSLRISKILAQQLSGHIKQGPFYVISKTSMPAILIEVGFLSHNKDYKQLVNPNYQKRLAEKMADSIKQFCVDSGHKYAKVGACEMMVDKKIN